MPPPKLPVPEISPSMQKLQQIGQEPTPSLPPQANASSSSKVTAFDPTKPNLQPPPQSSSPYTHPSISSSSSSIQQQHPPASKSMSMKNNINNSTAITAVTTTFSTTKTPIMSSPTPLSQAGVPIKNTPVSSSHHHHGGLDANLNNSRTSVISPTNATPRSLPVTPLSLSSTTLKSSSKVNSNSSIPSEIEEIKRSFIRQQQSVHKDSKTKDSTTTGASSTKTVKKTSSKKANSNKSSSSNIQHDASVKNQQQQVFFPGGVPVHPSQLLRKKWKPGQSPTTPSPTSTPTATTTTPKQQVPGNCNILFICFTQVI